MTISDLCVDLSNCDISNVPEVGGKNASLGEMIQHLEALGVSVPGGFATTAHAFRAYMAESGLDKIISDILKGLNTSDVTALRKAGRECRQAILLKPFSATLSSQIEDSYLKMCKKYRGGAEVDVAVRSSATAEDLPNASFAGQQETFLNVRGFAEVIQACHRCFASLFTDRAISYRVQMGFSHNQVALSVGIQLMIRSDLASSGVMFSIDTESGFRNAVLINGAYGLGENVVQGAVNPDEFLVFKPTLATGRPILEKRLGSKEIRMIYDVGGGKNVKNIPVAICDRQTFCLTDDQVLTLAKWAVIIEEHYSKRHERFCPMDIEWALDGDTNSLWIVQARPETVVSQKTLKQNSIITSYTLKSSESPLKIVVRGNSVGNSIGKGRARIITNLQSMKDFQSGEVLVTTKTDPDWEPIMKKASGIITNFGGRTCHAAIIARELGIPAVVGCGDATEKISNGQQLTLLCSSGKNGLVYDGLLPFEKKDTAIDILPKTKTQILMNVGNPSDAFRLSFLPVNGVGLARLEFIIANHVKVHPLALTRYKSLSCTPSELAEINDLTREFAEIDSKPQYFVDHLASGIALIAAAFYPNPVIVRMSDFKTNEYANLLGGKQFEPLEENPMLGWRGASRYYHENYSDGFALECAAFVKVRQTMGLKNVIPMIPFCRTPAEGERVLAEMAKNGLVKGKDGLQVYVMCEIPSNVLLADAFLSVFDGFSIGSNDLTQLTLGLDRDSEIVAPLFDERSPAVRTLISLAIKAAKNAGKKIGICGDAPSSFPDFAKFLVEEGIDSISLTPDDVIQTILNVAQYEKSK